MFKFKQKDSEFFDLFVESAQYFYQGALMMDEVMLDYSKAADKVKEVVDLEHAADAVNDKIIDKLNLTFITPIDREDIIGLAQEPEEEVPVLEAAAHRLVVAAAALPRDTANHARGRAAIMRHERGGIATSRLGH